MSYAKHIADPSTPQSEKARDEQVLNTAGGYVFKIDDWKRLERFLIIGNEGGTYYASERKLTVENAQCIIKLLGVNGKKIVDKILEISDSGRAAKNTPAIFALAMCSVYGDEKIRAYANKIMPRVCRFSTDLFIWVDSVNKLKQGRKSKGLQRAIGRWYNEKDAKEIAYQVCKYPGRRIDNQRWTHKDLLRIARPGPNRKTKNGKADPALRTTSDLHNIVYKYVTHGLEEKGLGTKDFENLLFSDQLKYIYGHEKAKKAKTSKEIVSLIKEFNITRESVPNELFNIDVWKALLPKMPMTALIRNLGRMTAIKLLKPLSNEVSFIANKITDEKTLKKTRIHPMNVFTAFKTYKSGQGVRTTWTPISVILNALEDAFYKSFKYVEPSGKKILIGVDVSGSMGWSGMRANSNIVPREAAAVVAMTIARTEKNNHIMAFADTFIELNITPKNSLSEVIKKMSNLVFGSTDCSLPMIYAMENSLDVEVFVILTDNETWYGSIHPFEALKKYRKKFNSNAKLAVLAFTATEFSIADPSDVGMLDIVGLDSAVPKILSNFMKE